MFLLWTWTIYLLYEIMMGVIKRRRLLKSNKAINKMERITTQTQLPITYTDKEDLKEPIPNDDEGTITTGKMGTMTTTSTVIKLGPAKIQLVSTRKWKKSDGVMNTRIGDTRKAMDDEFNNNIRRFTVNKYSGPRMTVQPPK